MPVILIKITLLPSICYFPPKSGWNSLHTTRPYIIRRVTMALIGQINICQILYGKDQIFRDFTAVVPVPSLIRV